MSLACATATSFLGRHLVGSNSLEVVWKESFCITTLLGRLNSFFITQAQKLVRKGVVRRLNFIRMS